MAQPPDMVEVLTINLQRCVQQRHDDETWHRSQVVRFRRYRSMWSMKQKAESKGKPFTECLLFGIPDSFGHSQNGEDTILTPQHAGLFTCLPFNFLPQEKSNGQFVAHLCADILH
jgi:hypothetical protein